MKTSKNIAVYVGDLDTVDIPDLMRYDSIDDICTNRKINLKGSLSDSFKTGLIQLILLWCGYSPGMIDSSGGSATFSALHRFQTAKGLPVENIITERCAIKLLEEMERLTNEN